MPHAEDHKKRLLEQVVERIHDRLDDVQAPMVERFVGQYYERVAPEDLVGRGVLDLYGAALAHFHLALKRSPGKRLIRVYNPRLEEHGWQSTHTVIELIQDDMPFLVDSARIELNRHGLTVHLIVHPVMRVRRDVHGQLLEILPEDAPDDDALHEAAMHIEVDRQADAEVLTQLEADLNRVMDDVLAAVEDWPSMRERLQQVAVELETNPPPLDPGSLSEDLAFLHWLDEDHFTFVGFREYTFTQENGEDVLRVVPGSGLGVLRNITREGTSRSFAQLPAEVRKLARQPNLLVLTKSNSRATVHRPGYLDYVGIKRFNSAGDVIGEWRFLGLYTSTAYVRRPTDIPMLRRKVQQVMQRSGLRPRSHSSKALLNILETLPRDELFQSTEDQLFEISMGILHLQERQLVRVLLRRDTFGRFLSCLVYLPRDRFNTEVRIRIQNILRETFNARAVDFTVWLSESVLARIYLIVHTQPGALPEYDVAEIEERITECTRSWEDHLQESLVHELGEERGVRLFNRYRGAFPASYREDYPAQIAVEDIQKMEALSERDDLGMVLYRPLESTSGMLRFKLFHRGDPISLSVALPLLENMGVRVLDERPHEVEPGQGPSVWVHDIGLLYEEDGQFNTDQIRQIFQEAFARIWHGQVENDGFNRLVLGAQLSWRKVVVLRASCKYLRQTGFPFSQSYMEAALAKHPQIAAMLADLFVARFDPDRQDVAAMRSEALSDSIMQSLEAVPNLDEDRILRRFFILIGAMLRTNFFQEHDGEPKSYLSFKLDPSQIPDLASPRPKFEIFVYSPRTEGIHLRGGKVARGGIRWSDRLEDFRTEIFGLMKTQMVKNAVIVPVGAKGGFVVKQPPDGEDRDAHMKEVVQCYSTLIRGMLDVTDNLVGNDVVAPVRVVRYDEDDPYLVVAADKGTASFSDTANAIAAEYGFWLGDAFASGGSAGYDHKKMGITARGAWESVKRHFREMGTDIQTTDFTVVGIGSMNGDVFGNGMLLSRHIKLIAAFSHREIFVDPSPDPERSFVERERLFGLPRSSWQDYDRNIISAGGGVFSRAAKSIPISPQMADALNIAAKSLSPNELIRAILMAPVDLLWNGGIGTFVKADHESHDRVGDRSNDAIRINASELRAKAAGEGGNLGFTDDARIQYARQGGRISTDFIDNSGGVDCSDHEVNIKILLDDVVKDGDMSTKQRNVLLAQMTDEVAELVLRSNFLQAEALSMSEHLSPQLLDEHTRFMRALEKHGDFSRATWHLPDEEAIAERRAAGEGLVRPELSILLAYSKISLYGELVSSDICDEPYLETELAQYFPKPIRERFSARLAHHRLRREIIATFIANSMINRMGITYPFRVQEQTGATEPDIARAYMVTRRVFRLPELWRSIEDQAPHVSAAQQMDALIQIRKLGNRCTLWFLRNRKQPLDIATAIGDFSPGIDQLKQNLASVLDPASAEQLEQSSARYRDQGLPADLADEIAAIPLLFSSLDIAEVAGNAARPTDLVAKVYFHLGASLELHWLRDQIAALPEDSHWPRLARVALRDDLYRLHRTLTRETLLTDTRCDDPQRLLELWVASNRTTIDRYLQRLTDSKGSGAADLALLAVAVSEARKLIQTSTAPRP